MIQIHLDLQFQRRATCRSAESNAESISCTEILPGACSGGSLAMGHRVWTLGVATSALLGRVSGTSSASQARIDAHEAMVAAFLASGGAECDLADDACDLSSMQEAGSTMVWATDGGGTGCAFDESEYGFQVWRGDPKKVMVFFGGGGFLGSVPFVEYVWAGIFTRAIAPTTPEIWAVGDEPGLLSRDVSLNAFGDWTQVFIPSTLDPSLCARGPGAAPQGGAFSSSGPRPRRLCGAPHVIRSGPARATFSSGTRRGTRRRCPCDSSGERTRSERSTGSRRSRRAGGCRRCSTASRSRASPRARRA